MTDKLDILKETLCIKNIVAVIKGENRNCKKILRNDCRHNDAFVYVLSGNCTYFFDDGITFTVKAGDVIYLPRQSGYNKYIPDPNYKFIFCDFEFLSSEEKRGAIYSFESTKNISAHFANLLNCYRRSHRSAQAESMSILYRIYSLLQQNEIEHCGVGAKEESLIKAKQYIDEHCNDPSISIAALAEQAGISEAYFRKRFKEKYHLQPSKYLTTVRIKKARILMKYSFLSIEECALQSGFSSAQYFCRLFKKETGITPGEYRKTI